MPDQTGYLMLVLHAHLPFVRHPEYDEFLEEDWLYEAMIETYIPLLSMFEALTRDGVPFRLTMTMTPPLCEMLSDPLLISRFDRYLANFENLVAHEIGRTKDSPFAVPADFYRGWAARARAVFERWDRNLVTGFRHFQDAGSLEIITCSGTHCILPLCATREAARAHVRIAVANYEKHFGRRPRGIWLAECAYSHEVDELLEEEDIRYFFMDTHGIVFSEPDRKSTRLNSSHYS